MTANTLNAVGLFIALAAAILMLHLFEAPKP